MRVERVGEVRCTVGEGPVWDVESRSLFFVDLVGQRLWRWREDDGRFDQWAMPMTIAGFSLDGAGDGVVALADGFHRLDLASGALTPIARPALVDGTQINDVKVDRDGRFVGGSMSRDMKTEAGGLFVLDRGAVRPLDDGFVLMNGPCWSPDGSVFYCSDTMRNVIYAYDYHRADAGLANRRIFARTEAEGLPDGATVDASGNLWVAMLGSGNIVVYSPVGEVVRRVALPTKFVASVMFGGEALDRLYVTTLDPSVVGQQGDEGATYLYVVDGLDAVGIAEKRVASA